MPLFQTRTCALALVLLASSCTTAFAVPGADSAYLTDPQSSHVEDQTSQGIGEVNMIVCIMSAMRADALVNEDDYIALVDKNKCEASKSGQAGGAGSDGATAAASYMTSFVNSSRASNNDPMIVKSWIDLTEEEMRETVFVHISASEAPSDANPYGVFRLDFCGKPAGIETCAMNGYLEGADSGLNFFESESFDGFSRTVALRLDTVGTTSGNGRMEMLGDEGDGGFTFAYDQDLFRRSDGTDEQCFARDASDVDTGLSVWRYGLYDADTGARITRNSGFPIEFTHDGQTFHGFLGYYGLSLPPEAANALENGATVEKVDYAAGDEPTRTSYTVLRAGGKLVKYTRHARTLAEMDQIAFNTFIADNADDFFTGAAPFTQYVLHWDEASGTFKVTAQMNCGGNGCQNENLESEQTVLPSYWATRGGAQGWSEALGGEIFINLQGAGDTVVSADVQVLYRSQDLVYPPDLPAQLFCVRECPTAAALNAYFVDGSNAQSPFVATTFNNWNPTPAGDLVQYTTSVDSGLLIDANGDDVVFTDGEALNQRPQYQWGVRSGRLFTSLADAECAANSATYCDWKVNELEVYYQWETGPNSWNQFAAVKDGSGDFVTFDPPLQVAFEVPAGAAYGPYAGQSIVLQYGGFGDLWGIPGHCVSRITNEPVENCDESSRYVPAFVVPFDATTGRVTAADDTVYLVKWLDREIRFAKKDLSLCTNAGLELPSDVTLPTAADLKDPSDPGSDVYIGVQPTVTDAPRVIHGEVKF